ncbi:MAG: SMC-Scp complex subunit ScpB, partial [Pseudorhodoplanes sp.]
MARLAEQRMTVISNDDEQTDPAGSEAPAARPEEMRLLEALLFAAASPHDEKTHADRLPSEVDVKAALSRQQLEYAP